MKPLNDVHSLKTGQPFPDMDQSDTKEACPSAALKESQKYGLLHCIAADFKANKGDVRGIVVTAMFRLAHALRTGPKWLLPVTILYGVFYRLAVTWIMGIDLPWKTSIGPGLGLFHGVGLVVSDKAVIGSYCTLRHNTTIARKYHEDGTRTDAPRLGNHVNVMPHSIILGPINIGDGAIIGAGSVVLKDVPAKAIVAGNPARILRFRNE